MKIRKEKELYSSFLNAKEIMVLIDTYNVAVSVDIRARCHNFLNTISRKSNFPMYNHFRDLYNPKFN